MWEMLKVSEYIFVWLYIYFYNEDYAVLFYI